MSERDNSNLKVFYENAYVVGEAKSFTFFENGKSMSQDAQYVLGLVDWKDKRVLDVGCGTGALTRSIAQHSAIKVVGVDYAQAAIDTAKKGSTLAQTSYLCASFVEHDFTEKFDVICSLGTLEHLDDPFKSLEKMKRLLAPHGQIIIACPHFLNLRGYIWMALSVLFKIPMSLSDLHFIHPWDISAWGRLLGMSTDLVGTVDQDWSSGTKLITDFQKRLKNALQDANMSTDRLGDYLMYLEKVVQHLSDNDIKMEGATAIYRISFSD